MNFREGLRKYRHKLVPALLLLTGVATAFVYRDELVAWFEGKPVMSTSETSASEQAGEATFNLTVGTRGLTVVGSQESTPEAPSAPILPAHSFGDAALSRLREAFAAYEQIRSLLANDSVEGIEAYAEAVKLSVEAALEDEDATPIEVTSALTEAIEAAEQLGRATSAEDGRRPFGELSRVLVSLVGSDTRLADGLHIFKCPMATGYQKWFQPTPRLENPYMGKRMLECGVRSDWTPAKDSASSSHSHEDGDEVAHYTCSMHPSVKQKMPGTCPICGMDLTPVTKREVETGMIFVDEMRRQRIGVRTAPVTREKLELQIRSVGEVKVDETNLADVNLRMSGWVQTLSVNQTGQRVRRGQTLFTLYSPELYAAELEYLAAIRRQAEVTSDTFAHLARASRKRLRLLGLSEAQVSDLEKSGEASEHVPILAPASGTVLEKHVVEGARVEAGMLVYRIADLSRVWIDAEVYESDLPHVITGQPVTVKLPYVPDESYEGKVDFIYPTLQGRTRTGRVRVVLSNPDLALKPEMYANVLFDVDLGERLTVPDSAVVYTGPRRLVFVDLGEGKLQPKVVELGVHAEGRYEVKAGLSEGDVVVTSGNFLIAAESRIRSAAEYWESSDDPQ